MPNDIPLELIKKALTLCGKTMEDVSDIEYGGEYMSEKYLYFSIEKFCYYLLSPEFIERYYQYDNVGTDRLAHIFGEAIYEYQKGNPEPLISLLSKI